MNSIADYEKAEKEIVARLAPAIDGMIAKKGFDAKLAGVYTDEYFLRIDLLIGRADGRNALEAKMSLDKSILYSRGCCSDLDRRGGYNEKDIKSLPDLATLRAARAAFAVMKQVSDGAILIDDGDGIKVAFNAKDGTLFVF